MSFVSAIGHAISSVASTVASIVSPVVSGITSAVSGVSSVVSGISGSGLGSLISDIAGGIHDISNFVDPILNGINSFVNEAKAVVASIYDPIAGVINGISSVVQNINDNFIQPLLDPIEKTYTSVDRLVNELHGDFQNGISGLLKIPEQFANAFSSVNAGFLAATQQLGENNKDIASSILGPAIENAGMGGFKFLTDTIGQKIEALGNPNSAYPRVTLREGKVANSFIETAKQMNEIVQNSTGIVGTVFHELIAFSVAFTALLDMYDVDRKLYRQGVNATTPTELIDPGDVIVALFRGILSQGEAEEEMAKRGWDAGRLQVLVENARYLPSPDRVAEWLARGYVSAVEAQGLLSKNGMVPVDQEPFLLSQSQLPAPGALLRAWSRTVARSSGFLSGTLGQAAPAEVSDLYKRNQIDPDQANIDWLLHWRVPGFDWWANAFFRGIRTREEVELAAAAENIPAEIIPDLIAVERPLIQLWMVPDIIGTGAMDEAQATDLMTRMGFAEGDIKIMIDYGFSKLKAPAAGTAADLAKVTTSVAEQLYAAGTITRGEVIEILMVHKYSQEAAELTVESYDLKNATAARKAALDGIVADVKLGQIDETEAISRLYAAGYNDTEVETAIKAIGTAKAAKAKLPSEAQLLKMEKAGLITPEAYVAGLKLLGYSQQWAILIAASEGVQSTTGEQ